MGDILYTRLALGSALRTSYRQCPQYFTRLHTYTSRYESCHDRRKESPIHDSDLAALSLNLELPGNDKPAGGFSIVEWQNTEPGSLLLPKIEGCVDRVSIL
jgi:hypothetical protein